MDIFGACSEGRLDEVLRIIGEDPAAANAQDPALGSTPLIFAAHRGHLGIVSVLLEAGADIEAREPASNTTALHWASEGGHPEVIRKLVSAGAQLDVVDDWFRLGPVGWSTLVRWTPQFHDD